MSLALLPRLISIALGIWMMAAPRAFSYSSTAASNDHIVAPIVATFACIAIWEATRFLRWACLPLGLWLAISAAIFDRPLAAQVNCVIAGLAIAGLACLGGRVRQRFGGGWTALWRGVPE